MTNAKSRGRPTAPSSDELTDDIPLDTTPSSHAVEPMSGDRGWLRTGVVYPNSRPECAMFLNSHSVDGDRESTNNRPSHPRPGGVVACY